jgi:hypothetical protein
MNSNCVAVSQTGAARFAEASQTESTLKEKCGRGAGQQRRGSVFSGRRALAL